MKFTAAVLLSLFTLSFRAEAKTDEKLEALCERIGGDVFIAVWSSEGELSLQYTDGYSLEPATVTKTPDAITIDAKSLQDLIVVPPGRNDVTIAGEPFICVY